MVGRGSAVARIFVGIAWPYANGPFHIGHLAGANLPGDIFARFHRQRGDEVLMVSGSDMHGTPILVTAEKEGATPEAVARRFDEVNRRAFESLGFSFDLFTSTHTVVHERTVQEMFLRLLEHRYIVRKTEENAYCPKHARFLPDRYLVGTCPHCGFESARGDECDHCGRLLEPRELGNPRCVLCGTAAEFRPTEHFYLALDLLAPKIDEFLRDKGHWRSGVLSLTRNFLASGLHPTPITRDLDWGVPIPVEGYPTKRFYVWFDAVIGYLSASREWAIRSGRPEAWQRYWREEERVRHYYFIGKDNILFHSVVWPAILLGYGGLQLPYDVAANQWLLVGGEKMSKSRGRPDDVTIPALLERYPPDVIRFYAAAMAPQNHDTEFDWEEFRNLGEEVLANQWGNLVQRALVLTRDRHQGRVPEPPAGWDTQAPDSIGPRLHEAHRRITSELEAVHLKEALDLILAEVREGNRRFHDARPWSAADEARRRVLYETLWLLKAAATWFAPYLPFSSREVYRMLGYSDGPGNSGWDLALEPPAPGQPLGEVRPLFPKESATSAPAPAGQVPTAPPPATAVAPSAPPPFVIRAGVVDSVDNHPSADRLYVLRVNVGEERPRTVVAGMRNSYTPDELRGRAVALLANLEPRTIRKVTSQGMVLAAAAGDRAVLVRPPPAAPVGSVLEGASTGDRPIRYDEFERTPLMIGVVEGPDGPESVKVNVGAESVRAAGQYPTGTRVVLRRLGEGAAEGIILSFGQGGPLEPPPELPAGTRIR
ncbi:MAG TPA: methionine--tRNA ligase [Thermoplasmata archaeon]|nr:methionine--tRNA ligase [Thermoplasmata archaeon]